MRSVPRSFAARLFRVVAAVALMLAATLAVAAPAQAQPVHVRECVVQGNLSFDPALTGVILTEDTDVTTVDTFGSPCTDQTIGTGLVATSIDLTASGEANCVSQSFSGTATISWNNNNESTLTLQSVTSLGGLGVFTGFVSAGELQGLQVVLALLPTEEIAFTECVFFGIDEYAVSGSLTFLLVE